MIDQSLQKTNIPPEFGQPLVSVIIPTWNAAAFLPTTLETVFSQTWPALEIIVVDDGSTDNTAELLAEYGGKIKVLHLENSGGPSRPRNCGVKNATGEYIAFFDSDDLMEPEKISQAMEVFATHPEVGFLSSNFRSIDVDGCVLKDDYLSEYTVFRKDLQTSELPGVGLLPGALAFKNLIRTNFVGTSSVVCRRECLMGTGPFVEEMKNSDDIEMWRRLAHNGCTFAFLDKVLHSYRITPGGITARGTGRFSSVIMGLERHITNCSREEDRRYIKNQVSRLHLAIAGSQRRAGDFDDAVRSYEASLASDWSFGCLARLVVTRVQAFLKRDDSA